MSRPAVDYRRLEHLASQHLNRRLWSSVRRAAVDLNANVRSGEREALRLAGDLFLSEQRQQQGAGGAAAAAGGAAAADAPEDDGGDDGVDDNEVPDPATDEGEGPQQHAAAAPPQATFISVC